MVLTLCMLVVNKYLLRYSVVIIKYNINNGSILNKKIMSASDRKILMTLNSVDSLLICIPRIIFSILQRHFSHI